LEIYRLTRNVPVVIVWFPGKGWDLDTIKAMIQKCCYPLASSGQQFKSGALPQPQWNLRICILIKSPRHLKRIRGNLFEKGWQGGAGIFSTMGIARSEEMTA
jgi:hypothetical protein